MSRNINNCIQRTWTESGNIINFGTTRFRRIFYLDILCFYTSEPNPLRIRRIQLKTHT